MKTAELPVGAHVAYDRSSSRNYPNYVEAFVITHRPKGTRYNSWGNNGNHNTVGVAYTWPTHWNTKKGQPQTWDFAWVRPQDVGMTWDDYEAVQVATKSTSERQEKERKASKANRRARLALVPKDVLKAFGIDDSWYTDTLVKDGSINVRFTVEKLEAVILAVINSQPENKAAKVQAEVEAALALL